jgi:hypothetical protein
MISFSTFKLTRSASGISYSVDWIGKPHKKATPLQSSEEALLPWTTCSGLAARAFLEIGVNQPNLYLFPIH